jgi:ABC-type transport system substrate-binding protein
MPGVGSGPNLAESWSMSKDMLVADFTLRANAKFHNGEPVTAEDVKFSFERYRGGAAKVLKDAVKEIQTPAPNRVRFVFKEPWPDFSAFYGTFVASAGWVVPKKYVERVGEEGFRKAPIGAREGLLHQIQTILHEQVVQAPVYHLGFPIGVGPRVDDIMATAIPGFYMSPYEDLKLRRP